MYYTLSTSQTALVAKIMVPDGTKENIVSIRITPDYSRILQAVNSESAIPLDRNAVISFARLFLSVAHREGYEPAGIHAALDAHVKDIGYLLGIGVQKVHQAFSLRSQLLSWLETTRCFIGYAALELDANHN